MRRVVWAAIALAIPGCSSTGYIYVPALGNASIEGRMAADYAIPQNAPEGDVRVASFGIAELRPQGDSAPPIDAIHLHFSIADSSNRVWSMDAREQRIDLEGRGTSAPAFALADSSGSAPPVVTVPARGKRDVDLFFPLPPDLKGASFLPAFDAVWSVSTGTEVTVERTPFERLAIEEPAPVYTEYAWGTRPYWYDPYYVGWGVVPTVYWRRPLFIHHWAHPYIQGRRVRGTHEWGGHQGR